MVPASLMKVPTCLFALSTLGGQHKMYTELVSFGKVEANTLKGDLSLKGGGDPMLSASHLFDLALKLSLSGIKKIEGNFYYDETSFPTMKMISPLGHGDQSYNPGLGALNVEFNRVRVLKEPSKSSTFHATFTTIPTLDFIKIEKNKTPFAPQQNYLWKANDKDKEVWQLSTKNRYSKWEVIPIRNPGMYAAKLFHLYAKRLGIELPDPIVWPEQKKTLQKSRRVGRITSKSVTEMCKLALEYSNNLLAENLMMAAAKAIDSKLDSYEKASDLMHRWFKERYASLNWKESFFANGSGLSLESRIAAQTLSMLLAQNHDRMDNSRTFWSLLSISGQTGWLRNRLYSAEASHRVFAKTGSLDFVHNITGYFLSNENKSYAFTLMVSDIEKRQQAERLKTDHASYKKLYLQARKYRNKARDFSDELIKNWIQRL